MPTDRQYHSTQTRTPCYSLSYAFVYSSFFSFFSSSYSTIFQSFFDVPPSLFLSFCAASLRRHKCLDSAKSYLQFSFVAVVPIISFSFLDHCDHFADLQIADARQTKR